LRGLELESCGDDLCFAELAEKAARYASGTRKWLELGRRKWRPQIWLREISANLLCRRGDHGEDLQSSQPRSQHWPDQVCLLTTRVRLLDRHSEGKIVKQYRSLIRTPCPTRLHIACSPAVLSGLPEITPSLLLHLCFYISISASTSPYHLVRGSTWLSRQRWLN
jgi:hypothetical protein